MALAVCVTGELRTANCVPEGGHFSAAGSLHAHLRERDLFAVFDLPSNKWLAAAHRKVLRILRPVEAAFDDEQSADAAYRQHVCAADSRGGDMLQRPAFAQARKLQLCWRMVKAREVQLKRAYSYVLRIRPDVILRRPLNVSSLVASPGSASPLPSAWWADACLQGAASSSRGLDLKLSADPFRPGRPSRAPLCLSTCRAAEHAEGADLIVLPSIAKALFFNDHFYVVRRAFAETFFDSLTPFDCADCRRTVRAYQQEACGTSGHVVRKLPDDAIMPLRSSWHMHPEVSGPGCADQRPHQHECALGHSVLARLAHDGSLMRVRFLPRDTISPPITLDAVKKGSCQAQMLQYICGMQIGHSAQMTNHTLHAARTAKPAGSCRHADVVCPGLPGSLENRTIITRPRKPAAPAGMRRALLQ